MPVSFLPLVLPIIFFVLLIRGARNGKRAFVRSVVIVVAITGLCVMPFYVSGWWHMFRAWRGDAASMYQLARWHENHCERVGALILWPCSPNVESGYRTLERAAAAGYPEAIYALGVRLKYGDFVSQPPGWAGPGGNYFPQPEKGQPLIEQALRAGFTPPVEERLFYAKVFRK